jgi:hypothetical protein
VVEQDVIGHLIGVERAASDLLLDAQREADKRKGEAKARAESNFLAGYENIVSGLEDEYEANRKSCDSARVQEYARYNALLDSIPLNRKALSRFLDSVALG